jgi:hypothetical protein
MEKAIGHVITQKKHDLKMAIRRGQSKISGGKGKVPYA